MKQFFAGVCCAVLFQGGYCLAQDTEAPRPSPPEPTEDQGWRLKNAPFKVTLKEEGWSADQSPFQGQETMRDTLLLWKGDLHSEVHYANLKSQSEVPKVLSANLSIPEKALIDEKTTFIGQTAFALGGICKKVGGQDTFYLVYEEYRFFVVGSRLWVIDCYGPVDKKEIRKMFDFYSAKVAL